MVRRKNRLTTDALREVKATFSRFLSILVLSALAVAFLAGLRTTAPDMQYTADSYYDRSRMMDGYVISTLGLTEEDMAALASVDGIELVEGSRSLDAVSQSAIVAVKTLPQQLNLPEVTEGRMPTEADECVTESLLLAELGLSIGDTLEVIPGKDNEEDLARTSYTIVGIADSPLYAGTDRGTSSLGNGSVDAYVYIPGENFLMDYYTEAYFTVDGLLELNSYDDEYEEKLDSFLETLEVFGDVRAQKRYDDLIGDAQVELDDARAELDEAKAEAERELADAEQELRDARMELDDGWAEYEDGKATFERELRDARIDLSDARTSLDEAELELEDGRAQYEEGLADYEAGLLEYEDSKAELEEQQSLLDEQWAELEEQQGALDEGFAQYEAALAQYEGTPMYSVVVAQMAEQKAQLDAAQAQLDEGRALLEDGQTQLDDGFAQLADGKAALDEAKITLEDTAVQLAEAEQEIADGWDEYYDGWATLRREEAEGQQELDDALIELQDGEAEYADGLAEYEEGKAEAEAEIADAEEKLAEAQAELDDVDECQWYVLGRDTNAGFASYGQDSDRISNLANIFPIIFFLVAALACLTTMTRMVDEQRTQIGSLKAMGFSRSAIAKKYIGYAFWASFIGGLLGLALGCTLVPGVIANAFNIMYRFPTLTLKPQPVVCVAAVAASVLFTTGAALWGCLSTLMDTPANLMRPRTPKAGRRVFLERIRPLWRRISFTWKVTLRNLFRYQKRFWMTVIGIGGCTALIVVGFGLHDSIFAILDKQFDEISLYDATVGLNGEMEPGQLDEVTFYLDESGWVERYYLCYQEMVDCSGGGRAHSGTIFAVDDLEELTGFVDLRHRLSDEPVSLAGEGVIITEKLSELLELEIGDPITLEGDSRVEVTVRDIVENYVNHNVYMTRGTYAQLFGQSAELNTALLTYADGVGAEESNRLSTHLMGMDGVASFTYISTIRDTFTESMHAIDYAVVIIIAAAAALAFVVLYNLTNINITERTRELATLKVLGFQDGETTAYVYRENIFLTIFGIGLGVVFGRFLHSWLVVTVEVDLVMFGRTAPPYAYILAAVLTVVFSVIVNIAAHFKLKKVDMVESLKSVE